MQHLQIGNETETLDEPIKNAVLTANNSCCKNVKVGIDTTKSSIRRPLVDLARINRHKLGKHIFKLQL